jgi:hypothetical protein
MAVAAESEARPVPVAVLVELPQLASQVAQVEFHRQSAERSVASAKTALLVISSAQSRTTAVAVLVEHMAALRRLRLRPATMRVLQVA